MLTLIVPDIHEQIGKLRSVLDEHAPKVDRVVFLGDIFDSFTKGTTEATIEWLCEAIQDDKYHWCLGNHDLHYIAPTGRGFECSGFAPWKWIMINNRVNVELWRRRARVSIEVGRYLCSHAGYSRQMLVVRQFEAACLEQAYRRDARERPILLSVGERRGGMDGAIGGPLWMDWADFQDLDELPQLVGHTPDPVVRRKGASYCLDTFLHHVAIVEDDNDVEVIPV